MNATTTSPSRSDRAGLYLTILIGVIGAVAALWVATRRFIEVLTAEAIPVLVPFRGEFAPLPIGPGGALIDVEVDQALVHVADPAPATLFALAAQPVVWALAMLIGIGLLGVVCFQLARGRAFAKATVRLVWAGIIAILIAWVLERLFTTMGVNGTLSAVSDYGYNGVLFQVDPVTVYGFLALGAIGTAFQIGHRLQHETEGLV